MTLVIVAPLAVPLLAAGLGMLLRNHLIAQRALTIAALTGSLASGVSLIRATDDATIATAVGGWPDGLAIVLAADRFTALMISVAATMALLATAFAIARSEDDHQLFHPSAAVLVAGVSAAFLTADLFNLFVAFEIMLMASYLLLTLRGGRGQVRAGAIYVSVNLLASTVFLIGVGLTYASVGTVHLGELAGLTERSPAAVVGVALVMLAAGVKASLVPLHGWLPRAYVHAGPAVTALFSGLLTKAGVVVLFRLYSVVLDGDPTVQPLWLIVAMVTMVIGVLGAVGRGDVRGILAFHMVSQVGYLILPLGIWTVAGTTAGIVYLLQYVFVKGALFIAAGSVETLTGTGRLAELGGMLRTRPAIALGFLFPALALAGIPPSSGFVGKFLLVLAAFDAGTLLAGGVAVLVSLFTLLSMVKIWNGVFWGEPTHQVQHEPAAGDLALAVPAGGAGDDEDAHHPTPPPALRRGRLTGLAGPAVLVGAATIVLGLGGSWLLDLAEPAARSLHEPATYVEAVLEP
ncbi:MAG: complex I subunit 5 family protein [Nitriliruptoraceae bacterium]